MSERENLWPGWKTVRLIGRGSFGAVYEIERDILGEREKAALKVIRIPQNESDIQEMYGDGYDEESITNAFQAHLKSIVSEYSLMRKMNGSSNVVNCDDVRYVQHDDSIGWDIYIKMELLTPLIESLPASISEDTVIKIARDICRALVLCRQFGIVHRDIKPQNIFVSPLGDYKLGDFGIAKTVEKTSGGTKIGTYKYMAPEVYNNRPYGAGADIYSFGLVLYWLLNERRAPFLPLPPEKLRAGMEEEARTRRFSGEALPAPAHGSAELKRIVLKACAFDPKDRYQTADEMLHDLNALGGAETPQDTPATVPPVILPAEEAEEDKTVGAWTTPAAQPRPEEDKTVGAWAVPEEPAAEATAQPEEDKTVGVWTQTPETKKPEPAPTPAPAPKKQKKWWLAAVAAVAVVAMIAIAGTHGRKTVQTTSKPTSVPTAVPTATPEPTATPKAPIVAVSAGEYHTVGLRSDGTVCAVGGDGFGQCGVSGWQDIVAVSAGAFHTVGVKSDGTVAAVGLNDAGQCNLSSWRNIVAVSVAYAHTVGLKSDGTVVAVGNNYSGQCDVSDWQDIMAISAGRECTIGLKSDGTVVVAGWNYVSGKGADGTVIRARDYNNNRQVEALDTWKDIADVSGGTLHIVGLKSDGTVVTSAVVDYAVGQCASDADVSAVLGVSNWENVAAVSVWWKHIVGLKSDGTVVAAGWDRYGQCDVSGWKNIIEISAGANHTVGLKSDGTVVAVGNNSYGQCDVSDW